MGKKAAASPAAANVVFCFPDISRAHDAAKNAILGAAIGDAVGLQSEGSTPSALEEGRGIAYPYRGAFRGYAPNDWTDATDTAVLVMRAYGARRQGSVPHGLAKRLKLWNARGFPELGDVSGLTPESVVARVLTVAEFASQPTHVAAQLKGPKAENGSLLRSVACAFTAQPAVWGEALSLVTHSDSRCTAAVRAYVGILNLLARTPRGAPLSPAAIMEPLLAGRGRISDPEAQKEYMTWVTDTKELGDLHLSHHATRSYVLKTLGCAVWAYRMLLRYPQRDALFFSQVIGAVAREGGDSSANCAVVGAVLGAAACELPEEWLNAAPHIDWLKKEVDAFLDEVVPTWRLER